MTRDQKRRIKRVLREIEAEFKKKFASIKDADERNDLGDEMYDIICWIGDTSVDYDGKFIFPE